MKKVFNLMALGMLSALALTSASVPASSSNSGTPGDYRWLLQSPLRSELSATAERYLIERYGDLTRERPERGRRPEPDSQLINDRGQDVENPNLTGQDEPAIAIFGETLVAGWNDSKGFGVGANSVTGYAYSHDGGNSWTDAGELQPPPGHFSLGDPALAVDRQGNFYFASITFYPDGAGYIGIAKSTDGGETFGNYTDASPGVNPANFQDKEFITVDKSGGPCDGTVYVTWTEFLATGGNRIAMTKSNDGGRSFSWPIQVSPPGQGVQASFPRVGPDGALYVVWRESNTPGIRVSKSGDCGRSFGADGVRNVLVGKLNQYATFSPECGRNTLKGQIRASTSPAMSIDMNSGAIYVTYASNPQGPDQSDVFLARSEDGGKTWSSAVRVHDDQSQSDQFFPAVAVAGDGTVGVTFYDRRNDPNNLKIDVYLAVSTDGGKTFQPNKKLTEVSFSPEEPLALFRGCYMGDYNYMEADDTYFYTVWGDGRNEGRTWRLKSRMTHPRDGMAVASLGKMIYAISGNDPMLTESSDTSRVEMYDPAADRWVTRASAPTARSSAMAIAHGNQIYVLGGVSIDQGDVLNAVERYDAFWNSWDVLKPMPTARVGFGIALVKDTIYVMGGSDCYFSFNCGNPLDSVEAYDIRTGKWSTKAPMPVAKSEVGVVALDGKIYAFGGYNRQRGGLLSSAEVYDTATDTWESLPNLPSPRPSAGAAVCGKNILVYGGFAPGFTLRAGALVFELDSKKWKPAPSMKLAHAQFQAVAVDNKVYALGGLDNATAFQRYGVIEAFDCANNGFPRPDMDIYFSKERVHAQSKQVEKPKNTNASAKTQITSVSYNNYKNEFSIEGKEIVSVSIEAWSLSGKIVFSTSVIGSHVVRFSTSDFNGRPLANGVYLYTVTAHGANGGLARTGLQKLILRR
jgi:N-acetylneuraminic acid mutarotase